MGSEAAIKSAIEFANRVVELFHPHEIVLFGSQVHGKTTSESDIDIAVIFDLLDKTRLEKAFQLYKLRRNIDTRIEPVLVQKNNDSSGFYEHIKATGKLLYQE
jgi:uncharacterized protein